MGDFAFPLFKLEHDHIQPPNLKHGIRKWSIVGNFAMEWAHLFLPSQLTYGNNDLHRIFKDAGLYDDLDVESDPEISCSYWYFERQHDAQIFKNRVNEWVGYRRDRLTKSFEEIDTVKKELEDG